MSSCCSRSGYAPIETIEWEDAPPRTSLWCRRVFTLLKQDPEISILTHIFMISVTAGASALASYLNYNPVKDPIEDQNRLFPAALSFLGFCALLTSVSEGFRLKNLRKMSRKLPSPCVLMTIAMAVAAVVAYWMREQAARDIAQYQKNESLPFPARAYQILASDSLPDWSYAIAGSFLITLVYHASLRGVIRCRKVEPPFFIN